MSQSTSIIDAINRQTMQAAVEEYASTSHLSAPERAAIDSVAHEARGKRILDIGVGGGRTTPALLEISRDYIGVDYVQAMVDRCHMRFPGVRFENADARSMPQFADRSFDLIVFACNGIGMVDHEGRLAILREVRRLLTHGGVFIFSTYNRDSAEHDRRFEFPDLQYSGNPARLAVRSVRFVGHLAQRILNRLRYKRLEVRHLDYSIINDRCHDYQTMLYYISLETQRRQLQMLGLNAEPMIYDLAGRRVEKTRDDSMTFVVRALSGTHDSNTGEMGRSAI